MEKFTDRASQKSPIPYFLSDRYISNQEYIKSYIFEEEHIKFYEFWKIGWSIFVCDLLTVSHTKTP